LVLKFAVSVFGMCVFFCSEVHAQQGKQNFGTYEDKGFTLSSSNKGVPEKNTAQNDPSSKIGTGTARMDVF
jgi:lysozyme family protein